MVGLHRFLMKMIIFQKYQGVVSFQNILSLRLPQPHCITQTLQCLSPYSKNIDAASFHPLKIVGICGSIGSGKSFASSVLVSKMNSIAVDTPGTVSAYHIDTDSLAHGVYAPRSLALKEIEAAFGKGVICENGEVNRKALGDIVFRDSNKMLNLERIVWPHLKELLLNRLKDIQSLHVSQASNSSLIVVVEAAVLLDANWDSNDLFDAIWVITASSQTSTKRLVEKRGMEEKDALKRMEAQYSRRGIGNLEEELNNGIVNAVIENNSDSEDELWENIKSVLINQKCWKANRYPFEESLEEKK